jgi:CRISPR-associated Csx2 family protein
VNDARLLQHKRILLTTLSASPRPGVNYRFGNQVVTASQAPVALIKLLPPAELPDQVIILCTEKVGKEQYEPVRRLLIEHHDQLAAESSVPPLEVTKVPIPDGVTVDELWEILKSVLQSVRHNSELTLDVTHGYRSFPFLYFTASLFLKALRGVQIKAVYYAMLESAGDEKPIIDLSLLLDMMEWFYATRIFNQTGQAGPLCDLLHPFGESPSHLNGKDKAPYSQVNALRSALEKVSAAYSQALPLELGRESEQLLRKTAKAIPPHMEQKVPLASELFGAISGFVQPFALPAVSQRAKWSKNIELSLNELQRQALIIDRYLEQGHLNYALGMIREWMVSCAMYHQTASANRSSANWWIDSDTRMVMERKLSVLERIWNPRRQDPAKDLLSPEQCWLAAKWGFLSRKRNKLAHNGFDKNHVLQSPQQIQDIRNEWIELKDFMSSQAHWNLHIKRGHGTLLLSPLGLSRGLLYSALHHIRPDEVFIVTSETSSEAIDEIARQAGWKGDINHYIMREPFTGFSEVKDIKAAVQSAISRRERVIVNITGGTTAMQYVAQQVAQEYRWGGLEIELIALIDRRPPAEQVKNPYVPGEIIYLKDNDSCKTF